MYSPIEYDGPIFRPPSEARSLLIQLTLGCSNNKCTYCDMYRSKKFIVRELSKIKEEIDSVKTFYEKRGISAPDKVFLCDGDGLAAPTEILVQTAKYLNRSFTSLRRIGIYCTADNILKKSSNELKSLADNGINIGYLGLESGSDSILTLIKKGNSKNEMIEASNKIMDAGFKLSVIAMLGLGGTKFSDEHITQTAEVISKTIPNFFSFLTTVPIEGTPYKRAIDKNEITPLTSKHLLKEMYGIIQKIEINSGNIIFRANHVSNAHPLGGTLPRDSEKILKTISEWIKNTPEGVYPSMPAIL